MSDVTPEFEALVDGIIAAGHTLQTVLAATNARLKRTPPGPGRDHLLDFQRRVVDEIGRRTVTG